MTGQAQRTLEALQGLERFQKLLPTPYCPNPVAAATETARSWKLQARRLQGANQYRRDCRLLSAFGVQHTATWLLYGTLEDDFPIHYRYLRNIALEPLAHRLENLKDENISSEGFLTIETAINAVRLIPNPQDLNPWNEEAQR